MESSQKEKIKMLEAILFMENQPISYTEIMDILHLNKVELSIVVDSLAVLYAQNDSALEVVNLNQYVSLKPTDNILENLKERYKGLQEKKLTPLILSVLGIIAYKGPLTRAEIDEIRGIDSSYAIKRLLQEGLIELAGKKEMLGNPNLYKVSLAFYSFFGLKSLDDLPNIDDFQSLYTDS